MGVRFTRTNRVAPGKAEEAWAFSVKLKEYFDEHYELDLVWGYQWGGPVGVVYWWADFDNMGHWEELSMSMVSDDGLNAIMAEAVGLFVDTGTDTIVRLE